MRECGCRAKACRTVAGPGGRSRSCSLRIVDAQMNDVRARRRRARARSSCARRGLRRAISESPSARRSCGAAAGCTPATSACIDADGYLKIVDRIKDVVKTGGEWVSSLDIEDLILRLAGVAEVAVVGVPDDRWGERPVALVVRKPGRAAADARTRFAATSHELRRNVARSRSTRCPNRVHFVDAIPKTSVGKLDKKVIRAKLLEEAAATRRPRSPYDVHDRRRTMSQYRAPLADMQFVMHRARRARRSRRAAGLRGCDARHGRRDPRGGGQVRDRSARSAESRVGDREGARLAA